MSYTYVILEVSHRTYDEVKKRLEDASYGHVFHKDGTQVVIDMNGIALGRLEATPEEKLNDNRITIIPAMRLTPETVMRIANDHIDLYKGRLRTGAVHVNISETRQYLEIWESVKSKGGKNLTEQEMNELRDAIYSGDWDSVVRADGT